MEKALFLTDLDGTLLRPDITLSTYSRDTINRLTERGMLFTYATARSFSSAGKITAGLNVSAPIIVHNGVKVLNPQTKQPVYTQFFTEEEKAEIFSAFQTQGLFPIFYAEIDGRDRFSFIRRHCSKGQLEMVLDRYGDSRLREVESEEELLKGACFYFVCIDEAARLERVLKVLKEKYRCFFLKDIYSGEFWLEIIVKRASKASAAQYIKELLGCEKIVCFGDDVNDIPMFEIADECYAVENAKAELKRIATGVIPASSEDGVAKFLQARFEDKQ